MGDAVIEQLPEGSPFIRQGCLLYSTPTLHAYSHTLSLSLSLSNDGVVGSATLNQTSSSSNKRAPQEPAVGRWAEASKSQCMHVSSRACKSVVRVRVSEGVGGCGRVRMRVRLVGWLVGWLEQANQEGSSGQPSDRACPPPHPLGETSLIRARDWVEGPRIRAKARRPHRSCKTR